MSEKYSYSDKIKSPSKIGMSDHGSLSTLGRDIDGLRGYMKLLIKGGGRASKVNGPLGDKYFIETIQNCKDINTNDTVPRSIYINNVPYGNVPFLTGGGMNRKYREFRGLIPGILSSVDNIKPLGIITALSESGTPVCQKVSLETIDNSNRKGVGHGYLTHHDIKAMSACWFPNGRNFLTKQGCIESFMNPDDEPDNLNIYICIYFAVILILLFCITHMK